MQASNVVVDLKFVLQVFGCGLMPSPASTAQCASTLDGPQDKLEVLNVYQVGSRVYGTAEEDSDWYMWAPFSPHGPVSSSINIYFATFQGLSFYCLRQLRWPKARGEGPAECKHLCTLCLQSNGEGAPLHGSVLPLSATRAHLASGTHTHTYSKAIPPPVHSHQKPRLLRCITPPKVIPTDYFLHDWSPQVDSLQMLPSHLVCTLDLKN